MVQIFPTQAYHSCQVLMHRDKFVFQVNFRYGLICNSSFKTLEIARLVSGAVVLLILRVTFFALVKIIEFYCSFIPFKNRVDLPEVKQDLNI